MRNVRDVIDEQGIRTMVETFYGRVRHDPLLGPVFEERLGGSWPDHISRMVDFWASVLLGAGRYQGNPLAKHRAIPELGPEHFDRWLELFEEVLGEVFPDYVTSDVLGRARRMRLVLDPGSTPDASHDSTVLHKTRAAS
jgi:hemoglobin